MVLRALKGVKKISSKNLGLGKFWPGFKISEAFVIGRKVSFSVILCLGVSNFFKPWSKILKPGSHGLKKTQIYHSIPLLKCEDSKVKLNQATRC